MFDTAFLSISGTFALPCRFLPCSYLSQFRVPHIMGFCHEQHCHTYSNTNHTDRVVQPNTYSIQSEEMQSIGESTKQTQTWTECNRSNCLLSCPLVHRSPYCTILKEWRFRLLVYYLRSRNVESTIKYYANLEQGAEWCLTKNIDCSPQQEPNLHKAVPSPKNLHDPEVQNSKV